VPAASILLVETDRAAGDVIADLLTKVGYTVDVAPNPADALRQVVGHQLVILDEVGEGGSIALCREIRATVSMSAIPVLCISQSDQVEDRIIFLEAGADDVVAKPFDGRELEARVDALLLRFQRSRDLAPVLGVDGKLVSEHPRRIVAVFSPKGGVGTTTIATNIALALAGRRPDRVCLVDLDLQFGQVTTHLNLTPSQTLADMVRDEPSLREPELLRTYAARHDSGLYVFAAPASPEQAESITADHVGLILHTIIDAFDAVIIDAGSTLDERTMTIFERAESVIFPIYAEIAALKALHTLLEYLNEAGSVYAKSSFVLNNMFAKQTLRLRDVENAIGTKIAADLPYDPFVYLKAVNEGNPVVRGAPKSAAAEQLQRLSVVAFGDDGVVPSAVAPAREAPRRGGLLFRRRG
jgi:pilus assembly protein CpaE